MIGTPEKKIAILDKSSPSGLIKDLLLVSIVFHCVIDISFMDLFWTYSCVFIKAINKLRAIFISGFHYWWANRSKFIWYARRGDWFWVCLFLTTLSLFELYIHPQVLMTCVCTACGLCCSYINNVTHTIYFWSLLPTWVTTKKHHEF